MQAPVASFFLVAQRGIIALSSAIAHLFAYHAGHFSPLGCGLLVVFWVVLGCPSLPSPLWPARNSFPFLRSFWNHSGPRTRWFLASFSRGGVRRCGGLGCGFCVFWGLLVVWGVVLFCCLSPWPPSVRSVLLAHGPAWPDWGTFAFKQTYTELALIGGSAPHNMWLCRSLFSLCAAPFPSCCCMGPIVLFITCCTFFALRTPEMVGISFSMIAPFG